MNDTTNLHESYVSTGKPLSTGAIFVGPENADGTATLPTSADAKLGDGYACVGYIATDSVSRSEDVSTTSHMVWGGVEVLQSMDSYTQTYSWTCAETNETVLKMIYGDTNVSGTVEEGIKVHFGPDGYDKVRVYVILVVHANGSIEKLIIPRGKLKSVDTVNYGDSNLITFPMTVSALAGGIADNRKATSMSVISKPGLIDSVVEPMAAKSGSTVTTAGKTTTKAGE